MDQDRAEFQSLLNQIANFVEMIPNMLALCVQERKVIALDRVSIIHFKPICNGYYSLDILLVEKRFVIRCLKIAESESILLAAIVLF